MRTLIGAVLVLFISSCQKENALPANTSAATANGHKLIVPTEIYVNDQLSQTLSYENGRIVRSEYFPANGVATYTYDDINQVTTTEYSEAFFHAVTKDSYNANKKVISSSTTGEYLDFGGNFTNLTTYTYSGDLVTDRRTESGFESGGFESKSIYEEKLHYVGQKLVSIDATSSVYQNGELLFTDQTKTTYQWNGIHDVTILGTNGPVTTLSFSPMIKSPYYFTGVVTNPAFFKNKDHRSLKTRFSPQSNMLRILLKSESADFVTTSSLGEIVLTSHHFPASYTQYDHSRAGEFESSITTKFRFTYAEIEP